MTDTHRHEEHEHVVRRSFARQVALFSGPDSPFAPRPESTLAWIEPLEPDMLVLDVACGAGHGAEPIAPHVRQVVGIDLTPELLALGAERLRDNGITNVLLQEANAESLPFVDESFDLVFCRGSLHHFADPPQAVAEMVRTCRPGGRIVLSDVVAPNADVRDVYDGLHRRIDPSHVRAFLERELAETLPGGIDGLTYANTTTFRFPIEVTFTEQTERDAIVAALEAEMRGDGPATGFEPAREDGQLVVSFVSCVVHSRRPEELSPIEPA